MILKSFSIYDKAANQYGNPMFFNSDAEAIRMFYVILTDPNGRFSQFMEDFMLVEVGMFDTDAGIISPIEHHLVADYNVVVAMLDKSKKSGII